MSFNLLFLSLSLLSLPPAFFDPSLAMREEEGGEGGEHAEGPDVVVGWRRGGAAGAMTTSRTTSTTAVDVTSTSPLPPLSRNDNDDNDGGGGGRGQQQQGEQLSPSSSAMPVVLTKNQKHKLRKKRCRLAKRLMQVRWEIGKKKERKTSSHEKKEKTRQKKQSNAFFSSMSLFL